MQQTLKKPVLKEPLEQQSFKTRLNNLCQIVKVIKLSVSCSFVLYEMTVRDLLNFLCHDFNEDFGISEPIEIDNKLTELFRCFEINRIIPILNKFFEEKKFTLKEADNRFLNQLLINLINLLSWPFANKMDELICCVMTILAIKLQKFQILINVCELKCDYILDLISFKNSRESALNLLSFFLINYQHSPKLFHKSCVKICLLLKILKSKRVENEAARAGSYDVQCPSEEDKIYQHLGLLAFVSISKFGGYPQLYQPILDIILDDISLTEFDTFRDKYSLEKISANLKLLSSNEKSDLFKTIYNSKASFKRNDGPEIIDLGPILVKLGPSLTGLINLGNTCYLNSIIQSLFSCKIFVKSIIELELNRSVSSENSYLNQLQNVFTQMYLTKRPAIKPSSLVKNCTPSWFRFGQQQDSSEFLNFLLDNLNEQLKSSYKDTMSLIKTSFGILLATHCQCSCCSSITIRKESCYYLPLSFKSESKTEITAKIPKTSLQTLIDDFFAIEKLTSEAGNSYFCSQCNSLQNAAKNIIFTREKTKDPPDYLILTLNRFVYTLANGSVANNKKIMEQIDYPNIVEIKTYNESNELIIEKYSLLSIVVHSGSSLHYGHYYTYMKNGNNSFEWYLANDSVLTKASFESLMSAQSTFKDDTPYILFYEKLSGEEVPTQFEARKNLIEAVEQDNQVFEIEERDRKKKTTTSRNLNTNINSSNSKKDNDDNDGPSSHNPSNESQNIGPRIIF